MTSYSYNSVIFSTQSPQNECAVSANGSVLVIVAILNVVLVIAMAVTLTRSSFDPLATLGDAIRSFLLDSDPTTANMSLLTKLDLQQGRWGPDATKQCTPRNHYWLEAPSLSRWVLTILSWLLIAGPTAATIALMARASSEGISTPFGTATSETTFSFPIPVDTIQLSLIAALPQLLLAALYLSTNALLTTYFLSRELSLFAISPRSLRVSSSPRGDQTASLYLSLPRPVSWFLLATFAGLGFVLSQSVFPLVVSPSPSPSPEIALNTQALLTLISLLALLLFSVLGLGLRRTAAPRLQNGTGRTATGNPLALGGAPCSALISARCHAVRGEEEGEGQFWLGPVVWGVVEEATDARRGRCAFTGREAVGVVDVEREYA